MQRAVELTTATPRGRWGGRRDILEFKLKVSGRRMAQRQPGGGVAWAGQVSGGVAWRRWEQDGRLGPRGVAWAGHGGRG